ncbi:hypothetical protein J4E90_004999 [Alternaria incomplexa]|uniref:uncharacterized protein n=1 Tax=Alternaria incomplexa TaxID=1187928 RepID=UPI002220EE12|nr:uncharacterized protein J4E90_004999 [Alternaria incomplexa]KAI4914962.1 hypothetical protein J4E90_004999 [Alternaria incomplexa]
MDGEKMEFGKESDYFPFHFFPPSKPLPPAQGPTGAGAKMSLSLDVFPPGPGAGDDKGANSGSGVLAFATTKQVPTLKEKDLSRLVEEESDYNMSGQEDSVEQIRRDRDEYKESLDREYDRYGNLESQHERLKESLAKSNNDLADLRRRREDTSFQLDQSTSLLAQEQEKIHTLETRNAKLAQELQKNETALSEARKQIENLHADVQQAQQNVRAALADRDEYKVELEDLNLQFKDLTAQWQEGMETIAELKETLEDHINFEEKNNLQGDIAEANAEHERILRVVEVKDERISHLESLLQKEIERNRHELDEKARAAAASPVDDDRHIGSMEGTLEAELDASGIDDSDWIAADASDYEPYVPSSASEIHVAASVEPRDPSPTSLSTSPVHQAASTEPEAAKSPIQTVDIREAASTEPETARSPIQTLEVREAASSPPAEPARIPLSFYNVRDIFNCAPEQPIGAVLTTSKPTAISTAPIEPPRVSYSLDDVQNVFSYTPIEPAGSPLALSPQKSTSTEPIELVRPALSFQDVQNIASTEPVDAARAGLSLYGVHDVARYAPVVPAEARFAMYEEEITSVSPHSPVSVASTLFGDEIANFAPREPAVPTLALSPTGSVSTSPVARQNPTAELSTQTDAPATTTDFSVQTDAPALTSQLLPQAASETTPVEPNTQVAIAKPTNRITPIMVTREVKPVEQAVHQPGYQRPVAASSKKIGFMGWIPWLVAILVALYALVQEAELAAWKNANGVGFGGGYGNVATRSGAYGNGRHLFGVIPIGMDIGGSWVSEQIARRMSAAISLLEDLAGIPVEPHY